MIAAVHGKDADKQLVAAVQKLYLRQVCVRYACMCVVMGRAVRKLDLRQVCLRAAWLGRVA